MRKTTIALLALCALAGAAGRAADPDPEPPGGANAELRKLKGKWTVTKVLSGTRELKLSPEMTFTFDGDKLTRSTSLGKPKGNVKGKVERSVKYRVKIDTKKKPHTIEMIPEDGKNGPVGIYKIEKGELYLALGRPTGPKGKTVYVAPKDFKGEAGPVYVMTREKAGK
jgi:uncharacterized protein (TIGR03067 family)